MKSLIFVLGLVTIAITSALPTPHESPDKEACTQMKETENRNKEVIQALFKGMYMDFDPTVIDKFVHPNVVEHSPTNPDGNEHMKRYIEALGKKGEKHPVEFARISADGDLVWAHSKVVSGTGLDLAAVNIFKLAEGKITEHWLVAQPIGDLSQIKNPHPFF